jgi:hexosaminidase
MRNTWLTLIFSILGFCSFGQRPQLIPQPVECHFSGGPPFIITKNTPLFFVSGRCMANVIEFNSLLKKTYGFEMRWTQEVLDSNDQVVFLHLTKDSTIRSEEGYKLEVTNGHIKITANTRMGMFYGMISMLQMMVPSQDGEGAFTVPACTINDYPRFKWRGMHLDVCRHFFGKEFIKKYIDLLALHKMNTFHWHLTEDQGWRIEIKKYPKLTEVGAWRNGSMIGRYADHRFDDVRYGGYYTQDDIREIVKYAQSRHVTIVPEIEMPGHALAALASYPELSCTGGQFEVAKEWGVFDDVYCAGNENTFKFIEDVLSEVCSLFPGKYIHLGGDECPKTRWKTCPKCQKRMKDEGLKNEHELQSYFIRRIERFLNSKGKQIIGWDEILEGGLAPNAAVMSWRGEQGGIEAANQHHQVVMSPGTHCYFDHYQGNPDIEPIAIGGFTTVEKVYSYDPVPAELNDSLEKYIMGAQGNVWTEYILDEKQVEYMAFPRACALAEVLWSPKEKRDEADFTKRLLNHFEFLNIWNVNYSNSMYQVRLKTLPYENGVIVEFERVKGLGQIEYQFLDLEGNPYPFEINGQVFNEIITVDPDDSEGARFFLSNFQGSIKARTKNSIQFTSQEIYTSKASSKLITFTTPPSKYYNTDPEFTLVNGIKGDLPRKNNQWNAWNGENVEMVIDLLKIEEITRIKVGCLQDVSNWIWMPKEIQISVSTNGKKYKSVGIVGGSWPNLSRDELFTTFKKAKARYVKIKAINAGKIPEGNPGAGEDSWMFFDEILID